MCIPYDGALIIGEILSSNSEDWKGRASALESLELFIEEYLTAHFSSNGAARLARPFIALASPLSVQVRHHYHYTFGSLGLVGLAWLGLAWLGWMG
jgi:hypothetical protein